LFVIDNLKPFAYWLTAFAIASVWAVDELLADSDGHFRSYGALATYVALNLLFAGCSFVAIFNARVQAVLLKDTRKAPKSQLAFAFLAVMFIFVALAAVATFRADSGHT